MNIFLRPEKQPLNNELYLKRPNAELAIEGFSVLHNCIAGYALDDLQTVLQTVEPTPKTDGPQPDRQPAPAMYEQRPTANISRTMTDLEIKRAQVMEAYEKGDDELAA